MYKLRVILEEFFRSFRKSLFKDVLLMLIFSISIVMAVILCSYYFDIGERYSELEQNLDDSQWYELSVNMESGDFFDSFSTVVGCRKVMNYYEAIANSEEYPVISVCSDQNVYMKEDDLDIFFQGMDYSSFTGETDAVLGYFGNETGLMHAMRGAQVDVNAYRIFGLRTEEGEGFTEENVKIQNASDSIPVVLGNNYKGIIEIGDTIDILFSPYVYKCRVTGILEQGSTLPEAGVCQGGVFWLDSAILFPYGIRVLHDPETAEELKKYAYLDYWALDWGAVRIMNDKSDAEIVSGYSELGKKFDLPPIKVVGTSMGVNLLRKESSITIKIMFILTIALICFALYGLCVVFYDKIQENKKVYGIYLMNGCSIHMILIPCLFEIAIILIPSIIIGRLVFTHENVGMYKIDVIMHAVCAAVSSVFVIGASFIIYIMRGVDTEQLIRGKE